MEGSDSGQQAEAGWCTAVAAEPVVSSAGFVPTESVAVESAIAAPDPVAAAVAAPPVPVVIGAESAYSPSRSASPAVSEQSSAAPRRSVSVSAQRATRF